jgi:hypothetical protein
MLKLGRRITAYLQQQDIKTSLPLTQYLNWGIRKLLNCNNRAMSFNNIYVQ